MNSILEKEMAILRSEVAALRATRSDQPAKSLATHAAEPTADPTGTEWQEVKEVAEQLAAKLGEHAHHHPLAALLGAFVLGLVVGRWTVR